MQLVILNWKEAVDKNETVVAVLLKNIGKYEIVRKAKNWLEDYLLGRK